MPKMEETNDKIRDFLKTQKRTGFVDVYHKMLNEDGTPMKELFKADNLHMNEKGYAIWIPAIRPFLLK
jgi:lysophospholipase L1-like esterase